MFIDLQRCRLHSQYIPNIESQTPSCWSEMIKCSTCSFDIVWQSVNRKWPPPPHNKLTIIIVNIIYFFLFIYYMVFFILCYFTSGMSSIIFEFFSMVGYKQAQTAFRSCNCFIVKYYWYGIYNICILSKE